MPRKTVDFDTVREMALSLPDVEESTSYGATSFKVRGKLTALLHQIGPYDPASFFGVAGVLAVAVAACWLPTRRAIAVDPATALRTE